MTPLPPTPVRYFIRGVGEVSWERMAQRLDRKEAALRGTNNERQGLDRVPAWVLLDKLGLANVKEIIRLSSADPMGPL